MSDVSGANSVNEKIRENILYWIAEYWKISSGERKGDPYSFKLLPFLQPYVEDRHPHKVFMKSSQTGVSEISIAEMFAIADLHRGNHLYVFPATKQLSTFVTARILDPIDMNPYLNNMVDEQRSKQLIKVRNNFIYFRGSTSKNDLLSVDASNMWLDERDKMNASNVDELMRRLEGQSYQQIREVSTPTFPSFGIDEAYYGSEYLEGSDCRRYNIRCHACNWLQPLVWEDEDGDLVNFINLGTEDDPNVVCICAKCRKEIDRTQVGEWVPEFPDRRNIHGYHISKWYHPYCDLNRLFRRWRNPRQRQNFYNHDAGMAYAPPGSKLIKEQILSARGSHRNGAYLRVGRTIMGADIGPPHHYWISEKLADSKRKVWKVGSCDTFEEFDALIKQFNVQIFVVERLPEVESVIRIKKRLKGKVYSGFVPPHMFEKEPETLHKVDRIEKHVDVNRHLAMSYLQDDIANGIEIFPVDIEDQKGFISHICTPSKVRQEDDEGNVKYIFPRTSKADHYFFAGLYAMIGHEIAPTGAVEVQTGVWSNVSTSGRRTEFGRVMEDA